MKDSTQRRDGRTTVSLSMNVSPEERDAYDESARRTGLTRHAWMREILNQATNLPQ